MPKRLVAGRWLALLLAIAILFTQVATAAHACAVSPGQATAPPDVMAGVPCAETMERDAAAGADLSGLCLTHCQFGTTQITGDPVHSLPGLAVGPGLAVVAAAAGLPVVDATGWVRRARARDRAPSLDHSTLHCCYRF